MAVSPRIFRNLASSRTVRYALLGALASVACFGWVSARSAGGQYEAYPLKYKRVAEVQQQLGELLRTLDPPPHLIADAQSNQILVQGMPEAHEIARQFLESVDRPPIDPGGGVARPTPVVKGYACPPHRLGAVAAELARRYQALREVRVTTDPGTSQVIVLAPPNVHAQIAASLAAPSAPSSAVTADAPRRLQGRPDGVDYSIELRHVPIDRLESQFGRLLGSRMQPVHEGPVGRPDYLLATKSSRRIQLTFDRQRGRIRLVGEQPVVAQLARLIRAMDQPEQADRPADISTRIIPVHRADPAKVREAVEAYRSGRAAAVRLQPPRPTGARSAPPTSRSAPPSPVPIALVQHAAPADPSGANQNGAPAAAPIPAAEEQAVERQLRELGEDVEFEVLPDLDVIILRGRDHDLDEVARIIAEIERISAETIPAIDLYVLRHVNCRSLITIIDLVAQDLIGGRQGKVHVTPLVKPNALLLVGWGEAVAAMKELIAKLDQPVAPETQVRVYRLRHTPVLEAQAVLQQAFADPQGLAALVQVTADVRTNSLIVRAAPRDLLEVDRLIARLDQGTSGIVTQARIFKLDNTLANDLAATLQTAMAAAAGGPGAPKSAVLELLAADVQGQRLLKSGVLSDVQITSDPHTNSLLVTAPAESMELLAALIDQLDSPTAVAQIKVFEIVNGDANALIEMLRTLLPAEAMVAGPQLAGAEGETTLVPVRFSADARTNSIIATGSEGDLAIIEALLLRLDAKDVEQRKNEVYRLKNAPALDVANAVNEFLRSERVLQTAAPGLISPFEQIEREVVVVPEPVSNALILSATPRYFEEIMAVVQKLDEQPAQVMIQVMIAEVVLDAVDEFGVELGLQDSVLFDRSLLSDIETITRSNVVSTPAGIVTLTEEVIAAAENTPGFNFNDGGPLGNSGADSAIETASEVGTQGVSHFALGRSNSDVGYGGLVLSASSDSVSVLIRALQHMRTLHILGRPQIMTLDNQSAFIQVGQRVPRIVSSRFDGRVQTNQVELENTGLILGVTPRISPEGLVVMEIDAEKSQLNPEEGITVSVVEGREIKSPTIDVTTAQTTISASDGETVVLGGLITKRTEKIRRRIPFLSDVPVLGHLFRFDGDDVLRAELLIFLTPHVIGDAEDLDRIKQAEAARMHWCLQDVHEIHGPTGIYSDEDRYFYGQGDVIYPDRNPCATEAGGVHPQPTPLEELELTPPVESIPVPPAGPQPAAGSPAAPAPPNFDSRWSPAAGVMPAGYAAPAVGPPPGTFGPNAGGAR